MIFGRDPGKAEQAWKKKYYDSLEKLERKEKEWGHAENVMRNAMSRLSVVMDGQDPNLDRELDLLRHAIRRGADAEKIIAILASVLETVEQVEALKAKQPYFWLIHHNFKMAQFRILLAVTQFHLWDIMFKSTIIPFFNSVIVWSFILPFSSSAFSLWFSLNPELL